MNNIQKCIVLLLTVMLLVPDSAWAQESKQEFVIKGVVEDNLGPVAGASLLLKTSRASVRLPLRWRVYHKGWELMMYFK